MRAEIRGSKPKILAIVILLTLTALAAWPFLTRPGLPRETDAELHVFRAAQIGQALSKGLGAGYVRWAPDLWYGYGYPIFNYYSPLTYYVANLFTLASLDIVTAVKAVFILGLLGAAAGMYVFVRENWGEQAGIVAAAAFVFSPYILFIDPHLRGDLAEFFALALFPWLLWAFRISNFKSQISNPRSAIGIVLWAALVMTHALMALVFSAILVAWVIWQFVFESPREALVRHSSRRAILRHFLLVLGLSAIYWLPFVLERNAVHLNVVGPGQFDFHNHFVAWRDLFAASPALDLGATAPKYIRNLGLAQWLLALLAIPVAIRFRRQPQARLLVFFVLGSLFLVSLMLSPSAFVWEHIPLMPFIQFPWRLLGPAAAALAVCAGAGSQLFLIPHVSNSRWAGQAITAASLCVILISALPTMYPPVWNADFGPTTPRGVIQVELDGRWLGTTSTGDFVPSTVKAHPPANADLIASYDRGAVDKFDHTSLPPGASVVAIEHGPTHDRFTVTSPQPFVAQVLTFHFPGWRATVDGRPASITPSDPHGFITFPVPAGTHDVRVEFGWTLPRIVGTVVSVASLLVVVWMTIPHRLWLCYFERRASASVQSTESGLPGAQTLHQSAALGNGPQGALVLLVVLAALALKVRVVDRCETCFRITSPPGQALAAQYKIDPQVTPSDLAHAIRLLGFDLPQREVRAGGSFPITLYWKATAPVPVNYQVFVHLVNQQLWGQPLRDKLNPGDFPTTRWPLDKYVWDDYATPDSVVRVRPDAPPGEYEIRVGLYTLADGIRAPVFDAQGQPAGDSVVLPIKLRVLPAR